jgi:ABC-2 type transport system ATP-binding protein
MDIHTRSGFDPAVHTSGLVKTFGDLRAVDGIDLDVRRGEVFGVLGPNGAGKTTVLRMLATLLPIDTGEAQVFGVDGRRQPHMVRQLVGVTGQYASVDEDLTARESLWLFARLQGVASGEARTTAVGLLERFGLEEAADKPVSKFSGGMRRRLDLAASLIKRPPLIFLDEPTTGLDPRTRTWTTHPDVQRGTASPWELVLAGMDLGLPTFSEYRDRVRALVDQQLLSREPGIDPPRSHIAGKLIRASSW